MTAQSMQLKVRQALPRVGVYVLAGLIAIGLVWLAVSGDRYTRKLEASGQTGDTKAIADCHGKAGSAFVTASGYYQGCVLPPRGRR